MSAFTTETQIPLDGSTEDILTSIQHNLLPVVEVAQTMVQPSAAQESQRRFYSGDNAVAWVTPQLGGLSIHFASQQLFAERYIAADDYIELTLGYDQNGHELSPRSLAEDDGLIVTMGSALSPLHRSYRPTFWSDGGCSLEFTTGLEPIASLDQAAIARLASFANRLTQVELVPAKPAR